MCVTCGWLFIKAKGSKPTGFLKMVADQEGLRLGITSFVQLRKYVWARLIKLR